MTKRITLEKEDGSMEIIDCRCQNCGSKVRGFYDLFSSSNLTNSSHLGKWICRKCYNQLQYEYENKK